MHDEKVGSLKGKTITNPNQNYIKVKVEKIPYFDQKVFTLQRNSKKIEGWENSQRKWFTNWTIP